jgi:hypothetical protein
MVTTSEWRKCSSCKQPIAYNFKYYTCSVSTCNGQRTGYVFCSVSCFERHLPGARHKDAAAIEMKSPARTIIGGGGSAGANAGSSAQHAKPTASSNNEVLVIASRLKEHISKVSGYNTSQSVMDVISDHLRTICDHAIDNARADGRKTVMDRDFSFLKRPR